jgi:hypothetical protein
LTQEQQQIKGMLFLKQLDEDAANGTGLSEGKHKIVWEEDTLSLLQHIEEENERRNNTDYKRALRPRKPRPKDVMEGNIPEELKIVQLASLYKS